MSAINQVQCSSCDTIPLSASPGDVTPLGHGRLLSAFCGNTLRNCVEVLRRRGSEWRLWGRRAVIAGLLFITFIGSAAAQKKTPAKEIPQDERATLKFAATHHPELAQLLEQLRSSGSTEYKQALADVNRARVRLERMQNREPQRFPLELAEWQANSQIQLLVARLTMSDDPALETELRSLLQTRQKIRRQMLTEEQARLSERLSRIEQLLEQQETRGANQLERELATLRKAAKAAAQKTSRQSADGNKSADSSPGKATADTAVTRRKSAEPSRKIDPISNSKSNPERTK